MKYRLWDGGEDMGTADEPAALVWLEQARQRGAAAIIVPVPDDAPEFLDPRPEFKQASLFDRKPEAF